MHFTLRWAICQEEGFVGLWQLLITLPAKSLATVLLRVVAKQVALPVQRTWQSVFPN